MFKLESIVTPLLANYLNKYIKDLRADDLQLSLWKGEVVLNNLDLRLDAIEHDLGLPFTFVSGNIQELRIKVPWTRLTAEPVVIKVNTMECVMQLGTPSRNETPFDWDMFGRTKSEAPPTSPPPATTAHPPPPGYMELLSTRVINNVKIQITNLIIRYVEDDFALNVLVKSATYFTVNDKWEKSFVEVAAPDLSLRRVLEFHDLHVGLEKRPADGQEVERAKDATPLIERTFISCRSLTKFDNADCRVILATVMNILCDEVHVRVTDTKIPMVRRLVDLAIAFHAGVLKNKYSIADEHFAGGAETEMDGSLTPELVPSQFLQSTAPTPAPKNSSWTSWALSLIPTVSVVDDNDGLSEHPESSNRNFDVTRANTFGVYARKLYLTFTMKDTHSKTKGPTIHPILQLEAENAFLFAKSREAKLQTFRAAVGFCQLVTLKECPCGEAGSDLIELTRPILSFTEYENPLTERSTLLNGTLFGSQDDEKEVIDTKAPYDTLEGYLQCNGDSLLLSSHGPVVVDSCMSIEPPEDFTGNLATMTGKELERSNFKQGASLRVIVSPLMVSLDSAAMHRVQYLMECFNAYPYAPYEDLMGSIGVAHSRSPSPTLQKQPLPGPIQIPMRELHIVLLRPTLMLAPPTHPSLQPGVQRKKNKASTKTEGLPALLFQAERLAFHRAIPIYEEKAIELAETIPEAHSNEEVRQGCLLHITVEVVSAEVSLAIMTSGEPPLREIRTLATPLNVEYNCARPLDKERYARQWGQQSLYGALTIPGLQLNASVPELLLVHFCVSGLVQDIGPFAFHRTFKAVTESAFEKIKPDENLVRIEVRIGKLYGKHSDAEVATLVECRVETVELSLLVGETSATLLSSVLKNPQLASMRITTYGSCLKISTDSETKEVECALHCPTPTKLTIYPDFISHFIENLGVSYQYLRDWSHASLYREMVVPSSPAPVAVVVQNPVQKVYSIHHEKLSLNILDPEFEYLDASIHSGRFSVSSQHPNLAAYGYEMKALMVNVGRSSRDPFLGPVSASFQFDSFGINNSVASFVNGQVSLVPLRIGPVIVTKVAKVVQEVRKVLELLKTSFAEPHIGLVPLRKLRPPELKVTVSYDDLRSQAWDYQQVSPQNKSIDGIPNVNQVRFCESEATQTMTWRYPELRTITSVAIIPIPFQVDADGSDGVQEIVCSLQYLKRPANTFIDLRSFTLMESKECMFRFPEVTPQDFDRLPISDVWRVRVSYSIQDDSSACPISVLSLAGCMKINSGIIMGVGSSLHVSFDVGVVSAGLIHHVPVLPKTPGHSLMSGFTYDSSCPSDQEFCRVKLDKVSFQARLVGDEESSKITVESGFWLESDFVNCRFLTVQPLMEPCFFNFNLSYVIEDKMFVQAKVDSKTPLVLHCGQNVLHTLSMAYLAWNMAQTGIYSSLPIMNHIVICNDSCHVVRIRQYTTDECIYIKPKEMHPYSWRSQRVDEKLQFSVETYPNLWSEACSIMELGSKLCTFPTAEDLKLGLVCSVRALNNIQRQVILATQFMVSNQLDFDVELQMFTEPDYVSNPLVEVTYESIVFSSGTTSSTRCVPVEKIRRFRVRRTGSPWSESVVISAKTEHILIQIPASSGLTIEARSSLLFPLAPAGSRLLVLSPVMSTKNETPYHLRLDVRSADDMPVLQESILPNDIRTLSTLRYRNADYTVHITRSESSGVADNFTINLEKVLEDLPPRQVITNCADLIGDTTAAEILVENILTPHQRRLHEDANRPVSFSTDSFVLQLKRQFPYADTILLHIRPNGIKVKSEYDRDLVLYGEDDECIATIPRNASTTIPVFLKGQVRLGVQNDETIYLSDYFNIRPFQEPREATLTDCTPTGVLTCDGFIIVTFWEKLNNQYFIHHLTLRLFEENSIKSLLVTSRYVAVAALETSSNLLLSSFAVPKIHAKMNYEEAVKRTQYRKVVAAPAVPLSPFPYVVPANHPIQLDTSRATDLLTYVTMSSSTSFEPRWSYPRMIRDSKNKKSSVMTLNVPLTTSANPNDVNEFGGLCCKVSVVEDLGICHLLVESTTSPNLVFYNNCPYPLTLGEGCRKGPGIFTFEEKEAFLPLPIVEAGGVASYSYPSRDEEFPGITGTAPNYQLRIGRIIQTTSSNQTVVWSSTTVDAFTATNDRFVSIPGICYLKLTFVRHNRTTVKITIDPLSRIGTPVQPGSVNSPTNENALSPVFRSAGPSPEVLVIPLNIGISVLLKSVVITIDDEITSPSMVAEVLRLSVDDISLQFYCDGQTSKTYECAVNVGDLQLDNQLYSGGFYDFPVILAKEDPTKNVQSALNILCKLNPSTLAPENVHISLAPIACFVEDTLAFHLLKLVDTFLAPALLVIPTTTKDQPQNVAARLKRLATTVVLERIHIAPVDVYLSVHASLKMFVALDKTSLSFNEIELNDINSTVAEVWNFVAMHYIKGTLLRAGWVIGSMDLLGNPANLLRSLTFGCSALFVRPFSSLHAGPVSFLQGLAEGASTCLTKISAGTISSVTNLAESVSRNLDRVSLDDEHVQRRMAAMYRHPEGLGSGLKQGLSVFGMGLLGAVAGLVDQPMQAMLQPSLTPSQYLTAFMLGVTKGVVGALSKPVAGAASLVSQTGQGILRGHGLLDFPPRRFLTEPKLAAGFPESTLKYIWKVAPLLPNTVRTLCVVQAVPIVREFDQSSSDTVCLFLTDSALFVISSTDDEFRQAYSLSKLSIHLSRPVNHPGADDVMQVTLLVEPDPGETVTTAEDFDGETWPWSQKPEKTVPSRPHSSKSGSSHMSGNYCKESYFLEWKDARLFEEVFLVAKGYI
ncbi:hypothetical protein RvY_14362-2 [Ramazzottius varieornatus]|uniref:Chorein N-terminal domain-containing protein n=1 Tax=Ramazzottius varieornatus TaxID=947166 RepID=A0A1D1VYC0_RAMVA|nr:hypothetical protein RvY_14362-2 [Ramazzottius varieornatus]